MACLRGLPGDGERVIVLFNIGTERGEIINGLRRPDRRHERLGIGRSLLLPQDATQSLTRS